MTDRPDDGVTGPAGRAERPAVRPAPPPWQRNLVFGTIASTIVLGWVGDGFAPTLVDRHPLTLILLNAKPRYQLLTVNHLDAVTYYTVTTLRLLCTKPLVWLIGAWYGHRAVAWAEDRSPRGARVLRWIERHFERWGWVAIAVTSNNFMCLLAGSAGFSLGWFMVLAVAGTLVRLWIVDVLGDVLSRPIDDVIGFVSAHRAVATAVTVSIVLIGIWWQHRQGRSQLDELLDLEHAVETERAHLPAPAPDPPATWWDVSIEADPDPSRAVGVVAGSPIAFWTGGPPLDPVPEAWGTALCLPAARSGAGLRFAVPVDDGWRAGVQANVALAASWWGGDDRVVIDAPTPTASSRSISSASGVALCFTGGVDSFFSLLRGDHGPTHLLYVVGFDVPLDDAPRIAQVTGAVAEVARAVGAEPLIVTTDLLTHPQFASISWEHTHGAALAAVGHLLHDTIATLVIPPSYAESRLHPWGSRPDLDPRWGVEGRLRIVHGDASGRRLDRVLAIAHEDVVQRHLRVCWQNVDGLVNCGRCEKCLRTMVMLAGAGVLDRCVTFPNREDLVAEIDRAAPLPAGLAVMWDDLDEIELASHLRAAVDRLLTRSRA